MHDANTHTHNPEELKTINKILSLTKLQSLKNSLMVLIGDKSTHHLHIPIKSLAHSGIPHEIIAYYSLFLLNLIKYTPISHSSCLYLLAPVV